MKITCLFIILVMFYMTDGRGYQDIQWHGNCTTDFIFTSLSRVSLPQCIEQCARRMACQFFQYKNKFHLCELCGTTNTSLVFDFGSDRSKTPCISGVPSPSVLNQTYFAKSGPDQCNPNPCSVGEVCVSSQGGGVDCLVTECKLPTTQPNSDMFGNVNTLGSRLFYSCLDGNSNQTLQSSCNINGTWAMPLGGLSCYEDCSTPPTITNAKTSNNQTSVPAYRNVTYTCSPGYSSPEPMVITCTPRLTLGGSEWTTPTTSCLPECGIPAVEDATILNSTVSSKYPSGSVLVYDCLSGYSPSTTQTVTCDTKGAWVPSNSCVAPQCTGSLSSLYEVDLTYGICYKFYNSILTATAEICDIFVGSLFIISSVSDKSFATHVMDVKKSDHIYIGIRSLYLNSNIADWAEGEPSNLGECVQISRVGNEYLWKVVECTVSIDYIIIKNQ